MPDNKGLLLILTSCAEGGFDVDSENTEVGSLRAVIASDFSGDSVIDIVIASDTKAYVIRQFGYE
ncbi:MAG: hypothetical protein V3V99_03080 [candidate division Zixibacteria bacterium]